MNLMESDKQKEDYIVDVLVSWGLNRNAAKAMTYLQIFDKATVFEFTRKTGLRQPEISKAMKELKKRGWVEEREIKKSGKGRPYKIYSNIVDFPDMLDKLDKLQKERKAAELQSIFRRLRDLRK